MVWPATNYRAKVTGKVLRFERFPVSDCEELKMNAKLVLGLGGSGTVNVNWKGLSSMKYGSGSVSKRKPEPKPSRRLRSLSLMIETTTAQVTGSESETSAPTSKSMPRRLILLRHAKSSWENPSLRDHDRPLSNVGRADAVSVSRKLQQLGWIPELILSSDAVRTKETLMIMQEQAQGLLEAEIHFISSFYSIAAMDGQTAEHLQQAVCKYSRDDILTIMCMGHNRGWEEAASMFVGASIELKTCNAALLEGAGKSWEENSVLQTSLRRHFLGEGDRDKRFHLLKSAANFAKATLLGEGDGDKHFHLLRALPKQ